MCELRRLDLAIAIILLLKNVGMHAVCHIHSVGVIPCQLCRVYDDNDPCIVKVASSCDVIL